METPSSAIPIPFLRYREAVSSLHGNAENLPKFHKFHVEPRDFIPVSGCATTDHASMSFVFVFLRQYLYYPGKISPLGSRRSPTRTPQIVNSPSPLKIFQRVFVWVFEAVAVIILVLDAVARPIYRPIHEWLTNSRAMHRFTALIAPLPRPVILVLFAVPFAIAEPLKVLALLLIARGRLVSGIVLMVFAYLMTFLVVERIYHAGRDKLLTYPWFKWAMDTIVLVRDALLRIRTALMARARAWLGLRPVE
jgi:hypothetical protein